MDRRSVMIASHPGRVQLREQLTRGATEFGGTPTTVNVMVMRAELDGPTSKVACRTDGKAALAYCVDGALRLECTNEAGVSRIVTLAAPEEFVPCPASQFRSGYRVRLMPHGTTTVATWSPAALKEIFLTLPEDGMHPFLAKTHLGWTPLRERWAILSMLEARDSMVVVLADLAVRFGAPDGLGVEIVTPLFDRHIAALIGTERECVNRCINELIGGGLVRRLSDHRIWVSDALLGQAADAGSTHA